MPLSLFGNRGIVIMQAGFCDGSARIATLGALNPLRYRSYVYDTETGYYYLQSRYYDPEIGRFINADALVATGQGMLGNNMFSYCLNNPTNFVDRTGDIAILVAVGVGLVCGIASQFISGVVTNALEGKTGIDLIKNTGTVGEYVTSALTGAVCAIPGAGVMVSVICDVAAPAVQQGIDCLVYEDYEWSWEQYTADVATNLICDAVANVASIDMPEYIRDIKDEACALGKKGTKALTAHLAKVQNQTFMINQGIGVMTSMASTVYIGAFTKFMSMR